MITNSGVRIIKHMLGEQPIEDIGDVLPLYDFSNYAMASKVDQYDMEQAREKAQERRIIVGNGWAHPPYFHEETQKWVVEYWGQDAVSCYPVYATFDDQEEAQKYCKAIWDDDTTILEENVTRYRDCWNVYASEEGKGNK